MKKIYLILAAAVGMTITSCTSNDFLGDVDPNAQAAINDGAIHFGTAAKGMTRADFIGAEAAAKLGNKFVVYGYKGSNTATAPSSDNGNIVFDNYLVEWTRNTANTTESNSSNWEYVNVTPIKHATDNGISQQTIKYWDYSQSQYDFIAWSTGSKTAIYEGTPTTGQVLVSEITPQAATSPATGLGTAYTFEGEAADLRECYIADLVTVYKGSVTGSPTYNVVANGYNQPVTLKFRQLGTKVRIGIYETVPGYSVKDVQFYSAAASNDANASDAKIFTTVPNGIYKEGKYTVTFPTVGSPTNPDNNQAHIDFEAKSGADQKTTVDWGGLNYTYRERSEKFPDARYLGRSSNTASFAGDAANNYYVVYLPNQNGTNLNLRVNYTLESVDGSKETITVKGATAQVPSIYTQWKPGYAYTYLFKISDKTNGHTGEYNPLYPDDVTVNSDPAGLYPITFDAVVVNAEEDKTQETITTVSSPSITTYQKGSTVVNKNEYDHATGPIFVTVNDGEAATYVAVVPPPAVDADVYGYYKDYKPASGTAVDGTKYYEYSSSSFSEKTVTTGESVEGLYIKEYTPCEASEKAIAGYTYYSRVSTAESGKVVTLVNDATAISKDNQANLFTLPTGKAYTEADVVDALQLQDDDASGSTIKGRSGLVLTPAEFSLVTSIEYGVDGNAINLTELPDGKGGTYNANAMKFTAGDAGTYAFVYTKKAKTGTDIQKYQAKTFTKGTSVKGYYRYKLVAATTPVDNSHTGDVEKGVTYFGNDNASSDAITAFLGQTVDNLFTRSGAGTDSDPYVYTPARGYAQTGTTYYYTLDGQTYTAAHSVTYKYFVEHSAESTSTIYKDETGTIVKPDSEEKPIDGQAYYYKDGSNYIYCVIYPQRTDGLYVLDTAEANMEKCGDSDVAVTGMTYFDMYTQNNGVYYVKVIKVQ